MKRMMEMVAAETMMDLAAKANSSAAFKTAMENYAQSAWDRLERFDYSEAEPLFELYKRELASSQPEKSEFWKQLYQTVFT